MHLYNLVKDTEAGSSSRPTRANHTQRIPYLDSNTKQDLSKYHAVQDVLEDICVFVHSTLKTLLPDICSKLEVFCDLLPYNDTPGTYSFGGFVLNIQVCTDGHRDGNDDGSLCMVLVFADCEGGELVLYEPEMVVELSSRNLFFFPSSEISHFNLHFKGQRFSVVFHTDKAASNWVRDRNGWSAHIIS